MSEMAAPMSHHPVQPAGDTLGTKGGAAVTIHGLAWVSWAAAVVVVITATRNPWYVGLALAWVGLTEWLSRRYAPAGRTDALWSPLRFGLIVVPISMFFNLLMVHVGGTVIARLPAAWPLIGGPLTLEAAVYGALNGLVLAGIYGAFTVMNRMIPLRSIIQLIPRAYYPVAVITAIAVTFVPATLLQWQQIREAQAVRGHRLRGLRSWLPLWLPLLTGGMERALQLAEAMTARGFAGGESPMRRAARAAIMAGLPLALAGLLLRTVWQQRTLGALLLVIGAGLVLVAVWDTGRRRPHTRYRPDLWRRQDWIVLGGSLAATIFFLLPLPGRAALIYSPYPLLAWPHFALAWGVATWGLLGPVLLWMLAPAPTAPEEPDEQSS